MRHRPFQPPQNGPAPLRASVTRTVRFEEVDPLGIVWHGRYPSFLEDARVALGDTFGMGYMDMHAKGVQAPIRELTIEYHRPLRYPETMTVAVAWHFFPGARMNMSYEILDQSGQVATTAASVQLFVAEGEPLVLAPPFYQDFLERWRRGEPARA